MDNTVAAPPNLALNALRGAVGEVVGAADDLGCWDRLVSIWRIFWALDGLISVLCAIVHRLRAGEVPPDGDCLGRTCLAGTAAETGENLVVVGPGMVRRRPAAGVRARPVASVGRVRRCGRPVVEWGWRGPGLGGISPVLAVRCRLVSKLGRRLSRNRAQIVPI